MEPNASERSTTFSSVVAVDPGQAPVTLLKEVPPLALHHAADRAAKAAASSHGAICIGSGIAFLQIKRPWIGSSSTQSLAAANAERSPKAKTRQLESRRSRRRRLLHI